MLLSLSKVINTRRPEIQCLLMLSILVSFHCISRDGSSESLPLFETFRTHVQIQQIINIYKKIITDPKYYPVESQFALQTKLKTRR